MDDQGWAFARGRGSHVRRSPDRRIQRFCIAISTGVAVEANSRLTRNLLTGRPASQRFPQKPLLRLSPKNMKSVNLLFLSKAPPWFPNPADPPTLFHGILEVLVSAVVRQVADVDPILLDRRSGMCFCLC